MKRRVLPPFVTAWLSILMPTVAVQATPACGGIVEEDMGLSPQGGGGNGGTSPYDTGGRYSSTGGIYYGTGGRYRGYCGDGIVDVYEDCDGRNLNGATCASLTGVPGAYGTVSCSYSCYYEVYNCYLASTGGAWNAGGYVGMGGQWGGGALYRDAGAPLPPPLPPPGMGGGFFK